MRALRACTATAAVAAVVLTGCAGRSTDGSEPAAPTGTRSASVDAGQPFPDVEAVEVTRAADGTLTLEVTISSPYDTPQRYADGWRVLGPQGQELGRHELAHDHAGEQPFTRSQSGLQVPDGVTEITVEGRDLENGYGGRTVTVPVPRS